jgi:hypothetical protein
VCRMQHGARRAGLEASGSVVPGRAVAALGESKEPSVTSYDAGERSGLVEKVAAMDAYEALQTIQRLAPFALASEQGQSAEVLTDIQRRALNGIALVAKKLKHHE